MALAAGETVPTLPPPGRLGHPRTLATILWWNTQVGAHLASGWTGALARPEVPPGEGRGVVTRGGPPVATSTVDGCERSVSAVCPHLGGIVRWNDLEQSWDCPLHGSRFGPDGRVLEGPRVDGTRATTHDGRRPDGVHDDRRRRMKAVTWQGRRDVRTIEVPDPVVQGKDEVVLEVTTTGLCGSDLHLYEVLGPFMTPGDVLGHETLGVVVEKSPDVTAYEVGDRVVVPFQISCGHCFMCTRGLNTQCETTQVRESGMGAALFGYSSLYGSVPGGQAQYLRVPHASYGLIPAAQDLPDERYVYLSDVMPTAWQAVQYAEVHEGDTLAVVGLGPIGDMASRLALHHGIRSSASTSCPSASPEPASGASRRSTSRAPTCSTPSGPSPPGVAPTA
ncbi:MAG: alcohol dehydrogenase catalytic domain-containing protein [Aeromicrobium erythreum]